jgi:putative effector of murein hydrolase LrgA (UPF0299 family)
MHAGISSVYFVVVATSKLLGSVIPSHVMCILILAVALMTKRITHKTDGLVHIVVS